MPNLTTIRARTLLLASLLCVAALAAARPGADAAAPSATVAADAREIRDAWLAAFNSADRTRIERFLQQWRQAERAADLLDFHRETGGLVHVRDEPSTAGRASVLLQEAGSDAMARLTVELPTDDGAAPRIRLEPAPRPDDMRIPRLTEAEALAGLAAKADAAAAADAFAGVLVVARDGEVLLQRAWGEADRAAQVANTVDTRFRLGSANKMFTAVAVLQLAHAGKLSLDDRVGRWVPELTDPVLSGEATIRQLLSHAGGTGDIFGPEFDAHRLSLRSHDDYIRLFATRTPTHRPGDGARYSNFGFVLLGAIIERASGEDYYGYIDRHVFAPAGMRDSGSLPESVDVPGRAIAYSLRDGVHTDAADTLPWRGTAAGGGYATAGDLVRFGRALLDGRLLPPALLTEATRAQIPGYGLGFAVIDGDGLHGFGHGGGAPGMNAELRIHPAQRVIVVGLANVDPPAAERLVRWYALRMPASPSRRGSR